MNKLFIWALIIVTLGNFFITNTYAQELPPGIEEQISVDVTPKIPGINEDVDVFITSYLTDLNKADISWYINGSLVESGPGVRGITFKTGDLGQTTTIKFVVNKFGGGTIERSFSVTPAEVSLTYEALTYTPPFYQGRSLITPESLVKFVAIPNFISQSGRLIPSSEIYYEWSINGTVNLRGSGIGKDYYIHDISYILRPIKVQVVASPINYDQEAQAVETYTISSPFNLIYEKNPVFGTIFEQAVNGEFLLNRQEIEFEAIPYFYDFDVLNNSEITWSVNNEESDIGKGSNSIVFRRSNNNAGSVRIDVDITHNENLLQSDGIGFDLNFEEGGNDFEF